MEKTINWGIIGLGKIASKFAEDLQLTKHTNLLAVASRNLDKAKVFSKTFNANNYFDSYEALVNHPDIDVVYIATPHTFHYKHTLLCLNHGKAVLCEKPMGMDTEQVKIMKQTAQSKTLFLMEGIWTRFIPSTLKVLDIIKSNTIGDIIALKADFGFKANFNLEHRIYNKHLGGGALLDIGIYPVYLSMLLLGMPKNIEAMARLTETEVDSFCTMLFNYTTTAKAILDCTIETDTPTEAYIYGTTGSIKMHSRFHHTQTLTLTTETETNTFNIPYIGNGYTHEIEHVNHCLQTHKTESPYLPLQLSLQLTTILDRVKQKIGLTYN